MRLNASSNDMITMKSLGSRQGGMFGTSKATGGLFSNRFSTLVRHAGIQSGDNIQKRPQYMKAAMPPQIMTPNHGLAGAVKIEIEKDKQN